MHITTIKTNNKYAAILVASSGERLSTGHSKYETQREAEDEAMNWAFADDIEWRPSNPTG